MASGQLTKHASFRVPVPHPVLTNCWFFLFFLDIRAGGGVRYRQICGARPEIIRLDTSLVGCEAVRHSDTRVSSLAPCQQRPDVPVCLPYPFFVFTSGNLSAPSATLVAARTEPMLEGSEVKCVG